MTESETLQVLSLLRASYPAFYSKFSKRELESIVSLWTEMFAEDDFSIVKYALKDLIATHSGYPPDIAALKTKIRDICASASGEPTDEELWQVLKKAVSNGIYGARQEFEKLPPVLQRYCGSPSALTEMAYIDSDTFNTVNHGQFLKQIKTIKDREEYSAKMPEAMKMLIGRVYTPIGTESKLTLDEFNDRRNMLLDTLKED
jgi:hypothetical protein